MGGFVGFCDASSMEKKKEIINIMHKRIEHRGPKDFGVFAAPNIALAYRSNLAFNEAKISAQPLCSLNNEITVTVDGDIYNCNELCAELKALGYTFTQGDACEVILNAYIEWKESLFLKLRGVFAVAIWDNENNKLVLSRDFFGAKPLYYAQLAGGGFVFGSEIKSFMPHPSFEKKFNAKALRPYLSFQYTAGEQTFFEGVNSLPEGHYAVYQNNKLEKTCYYDVNFAENNNISYNECVDLIEKTIKESVEAHKNGDDNIGAFLSGGVDSSYVTSLLKPNQTFTVGFKHELNDKAAYKFDETQLAAEFSQNLGIKNHTILLDAAECFDALPDILYYMDVPQSNPSCVPLWFLAKLAKQHANIVFSGEGADEFFAGYDLYASTPTMLKFKKIPLFLRRFLGALAKILPHFKGRNFILKSSEKPSNWFIGQADIFSPAAAKNILTSEYKLGPAPKQLCEPYFNKVKNLPEVNQKQYVDMHLWMPGDILVKADRMSNAHSLNVRTPLLDISVMRLAETIPFRYNVSGTKGKLAFRAAAAKALPQEWATRPKKGFPVPIRGWLREEKYSSLVRSVFITDYAKQFFNTKTLLRLVEEHFNGEKNHARKIWTVYTFLVWYKRYFLDEAL
jgi:asparagine synthase (glutamine-hydrolysing)